MPRCCLLAFSCIFAFCTFCRAGDLTILNLSSLDPLAITITNGKLTQPLELPPHKDSGTFSLPAQETKITTKSTPRKALTLAPQSMPRAIIFHQLGQSYQWYTFENRTSKQTVTLRAVNLTDQEVALQYGKTSITIPPGKEITHGNQPTARLSIRLLDGEKQVAQSESPTCWAAFVFSSNEGPQIKIWACR